MLVFANAKVNIGLDILQKRTDGFHNIESVFLPIGLSDILEVCPSDTLSFKSTGIEIPKSEEGNLVLQAWKLLKNDFDIKPVKVHLHKIIPIGAGLGGGSSDAAFMLKALNNLFTLELRQEILEQYAAQIGSDCAFFIGNEISLAKGRGEKLYPLNVDLSMFDIVLVNPGIHIGTAEAYAKVKPFVPETKLDKSILKPTAKWRGLIKNDFEKSIFNSYPAIASIKDDLYKLGAEYTAMSGSGSSVFGLFLKDRGLDISDKFPDYFVWAGPLG